MKAQPPDSSRYLLGAIVLLVTILALALTGCTNIAEDVANHMVVKSLKHQHDITLFEGELAAFHSCLHHRGGTCTGNAVTTLPATTTATGTASTTTTTTTPAQARVASPVTESIDQLPAGNAAKLAQNALGDSTLGQSVDLHNQLRGHGAGSLRVEKATDGDCSKIHMPVSVGKATVLHDKIHRATAAGGWDALQKHTKRLLAESKKGDPGHDQKVKEARKAHFLKTYIDAFFGNGHIVGIDFKIDAATATADLARELGEHAQLGCQVYNAQAAVSGSATTSTSDPDDASQATTAEQASTSCTALAASIYQSVAHTSGDVDHKLLKIAQTGFVSRDGSFQAQVPSMAIDVDPLASPIMSFTASPAKPNGKFDFTAVGTDLVRVVLEAVFDAHEGLPAVTSASGKALLPAIPSDMSADLNHMGRVNNNAEIGTAVVVDRIIKGIGPLSLNNKALEDMITTLITTSVRKAVEKASWCWYACKLDQAVKNLADDAKSDVKGEEKKVEHDVERHAYNAAERICLALSIDK